MFRRFVLPTVLAATALLLAPTFASALGISIVSTSESISNDLVLERNETITVDLRVENDSNERISAFEIIAFGHDTTDDIFGIVSSGLMSDGGAVASELFAAAPNLGFPSGLQNIETAPVDVFTQNALVPQRVRTRLFGGIATTPVTASGQDDTGVDGGLISDNDIHFRVIFRNLRSEVSSEIVNLQFGVDETLGAIASNEFGQLLAFDNDSIQLKVIPEPGTALLMGLGLAGLATSRRRA